MERGGGAGRRKAGFTLAEVMVTVAVIALLAALVIPGVAAVRKDMRMTELDATAREIFLAAQNSLTGLRAAGDSLVDPDQAEADEVSLTNGDAGMELLLPAGAIDPTVAEGNYMVVFSPESASVLEVYYAQRALPAAGEELRGGYGTGREAERRSAEVGFYNGAGTTAQPLKNMPRPTLTVENGEELAVLVHVAGLDSALWGRAELALTVSSLDGAREQALFKAPLTDLDTSRRFVLDSLTGTHFQEVCAGLFPGEQIRITAEVRWDDGSNHEWLPSKASVLTNSLFASRTGDTVSISCGRHLQNLNPATSGVKEDVTSAVQTAVVDWSKSGVERFIPIENLSLISYSGGNNEIRNLSVEENGESASSGAGLFGRTSDGASVSLSDLRLVNPSVSGGSLPAGALLGLAGPGGVRVENCLAYWDGTGAAGDCAVRGGGSTGGLVGSLSASAGGSSITLCGVGLPVIEGTGGAHLGGLIGYAEQVTVTDSYAAVDQMKGRAGQIGGFIGYSGDGTVSVSHCYAVGNISAKRLNTGASAMCGFMNGKGEAADSYCAMTYLDLSGETRQLGISNGFAPKASGSCAYMELDSAVTIKGKDKAAAVSYGDLTKWGGAKPGWAQLGAVYSHSYRESQAHQAYPFPGVAPERAGPLPHYGSWPEEPIPSGPVGAVPAYLEWYGETRYGLYAVTQEGEPLTGLPLEGDRVRIQWAKYGILLPEGTALGDLSQLVCGDDTHARKQPDKFFSADGCVTLKVEDASYVFYPIASVSGMVRYDANSRGTYFAFQGGSYYFEPRFAAAIVPLNHATRLGRASGTPYQIRTKEQLAAMCAAPNIEGGILFRQTHQIDAGMTWTTYDTSLAGGKIFDGEGHSILGLNAPLFGTINGGTARNVTVKGADVAAGKSTGIFATENKGKIINCVVTDSKIYAAGGSAPALAGFIGTNTAGSVVGCSFRGESSYSGASVRSPGSAAGFAVSNTATLSNCFAAATVTSDQGAAAGFIDQSATLIQSCYANCITTGRTRASGFTSSGGYNLLNCYAVGEVRATGSGAPASGFSVAGDTGIKNCYAAAAVTAGDQGQAYGLSPLNTDNRNCYYLKQDSVPDGNQSGVAYRYEEMAAELLENLQNDLIWQQGGASRPYTLAGSYPFPQLFELVHWGDWPTRPEPEPPAPEGEVIGVFHYQKGSDGRYEVTAAALRDWEKNGGLPEGVPDYFSGTVTVPNPPAADSGFGIFYSRDCDLKKFVWGDDNGGRKEEDLSPVDELNTGLDLGISGAYRFLPVAWGYGNAPDISCLDDQGDSGKSWYAEFPYNDDNGRFGPVEAAVRERD